MSKEFPQGRRKHFFGSGGTEKNFGHHGWQTTKNLKLHWLKCFKTVPKNKFWTRKQRIKNILSLTRSSGRKSQSQQKLTKKIIYFTIRFCSQIITHFAKLNTLNIIKNTLPQHKQNDVSGWCQKTHLH